MWTNDGLDADAYLRHSAWEILWITVQLASKNFHIPEYQ